SCPFCCWGPRSAEESCCGRIFIRSEGLEINRFVRDTSSTCFNTVRKAVRNETQGIGKYTGLWWFIKEAPTYGTAIRATGMTGTKHSPAEIAAKLRQADELAVQGKRRSEILRSLGISPMTYHRWRKDRSSASPPREPRAPAASDAPAAGGPSKIDAA